MRDPNNVTPPKVYTKILRESGDKSHYHPLQGTAEDVALAQISQKNADGVGINTLV